MYLCRRKVFRAFVIFGQLHFSLALHDVLSDLPPIQSATAARNVVKSRD